METIQELFQFLISVLDNIIALLIGAALLGFIIGVLKYFTSGGSQETKQKSIKFMTYGLVSLFVITSVWGLVYFIGATLDIQLGTGGNSFEPIGEGNEIDPTLGTGNNSFFGEDPGDDDPGRFQRFYDRFRGFFNR